MRTVLSINSLLSHKEHQKRLTWAKEHKLQHSEWYKFLFINSILLSTFTQCENYHKLVAAMKKKKLKLLFLTGQQTHLTVTGYRIYRSVSRGR